MQPNFFVNKEVEISFKQISEAVSKHHDDLSQADMYLFAYATHGLVNYAEEAIKKGANVNAKLYCDKQNDIFITPIHMAVYAKSLSCVKFLIAQGAKYKPDHPQKYYLSPIHYAASVGSMPCIEFFLNNGVPVDQQSTICCPLGWNWTPLQMAASNGNDQCVLYLIEKKAEVNFKDPDQYQAIHRAAMENHVGCLRILLEHGANPNATNEDGVTPLLISVNQKFNECTELLLQHHASTHTWSSLYHNCASVLQIAAMHDDLKTAKILLDYDKELINREDRFSGSVAKYTLQTILTHKNIDMLKLLLDPKYSVDVATIVTNTSTNINRDKNASKSIMDLAREWGDEQVIKLLSQAKSTPKAEESKCDSQCLDSKRSAKVSNNNSPLDESEIENTKSPTLKM